MYYPCPYSSVQSPSNLVCSKFTSITLKARSNTRVTLESSGVGGIDDSVSGLSIKSQYKITTDQIKVLP